MQPAPLPHHLRHGPFSTEHARDAGVSRSRLRRTDLGRPFHGVRMPGPGLLQLPLVDRCAAFATRMDSGQFFSHTTAAMLWGLPLSTRYQDATEIHVSVASPRRAPKGAGVVGHKLRIGRAELQVRHGLPVPGPAEVWCELGSMLTLDELVQAGDALLRRSDPLATPEELRAAVEHAATRPGVRRLQEALGLVRARTDSPMETVLRLAIVRAGLPEPQTNYRIVDRDGRFVAFGDLVFPSERVVVEYDGDHHRHDPVQYATDIDRVWRIQNLGWSVVRITKAHLTGSAQQAVRRIRTALTHSMH